MSTTDGQPTTENPLIASIYFNTDVLNPAVYPVAQFLRRPVH